MSCPANPAGPGFLGSLLNYVDCQALAIGEGGYQALAAPGSGQSLVLTGLLTISVALFGYRMLFGQQPSVGDGVLALVKIGVVLTLALSWGVYQTLVYDVVFKAPAQLAAEIGRPASIPGANGGLVWRIDNADRMLVALARPELIADEASSADQGGARPSPSPSTRAPVGVGSGYDGWTLGSARLIFLSGAGGGFAALRLIAGVLLALGPLFIGFLLFDRTRGLFEGWLRVLAGTALGALGTAIVIGVELAFLEPKLAHLLAMRQAGYALPGAEVEIAVVAIIFSLVVLAMLIASARVAYGLRMSLGLREAAAQVAEPWRTQDRKGAAAAPDMVIAGAGRSRAAAVADSVAHGQRREASVTQPLGAPAPSRMVSPNDRSRPNESASQAPVPLGQSHRRTRNRASGSASRRDRAS